MNEFVTPPPDIGSESWAEAYRLTDSGVDERDALTFALGTEPLATAIKTICAERN